jgi:hypothetical protein
MFNNKARGENKNMATIAQCQIEFKNAQTEQFFEKLLNPKTPRSLAPKVAYQKFKNGAPVFTLITRD